jgi:tetratricopeptide (TPR) repeat protein
LKNTILYITLFALPVLLLCDCSTKKNTLVSRTYHELTTRYNVHFNGKQSYNEGIAFINSSNKEEYSAIIPMYPISHHANASSATTSMDRTIEKCRKAIKLHSIKTKPKKDFKRATKPEYLHYYNQEEFNPALKDSWILLGMAEFHKGEFLGAVGTFTYITHHYTYDKDLVAKCQLWMAKAYGEMGWLFEAEEVLNSVVQDNLKSSSVGLYASTNADLLIKKKQYKEAIPFLELALSKESDIKLKQRFQFILGELYQTLGEDKLAYNAYTNTLKLIPPYEMEFNTRIRRSQLNIDNQKQVISSLKDMLRNSNNKDYLDQIYYAIGNVYIMHGDTTNAIENYKLSMQKSTRKGIDLAITAIKLGDLLYNRKNYVDAHPCYETASKILTNDHQEYKRVSKKSELLGELVTQYEIVQLQDSLQRLSKLPESKRVEIVEKIIQKITENEKEAAKKAAADALTKLNENADINNITPIGRNTTNNGTANWYFYNPELMKSGSLEFEKKWGKRKLEDNWRRLNKSAAMFSEDNSSVKTEKVLKDSTDTTKTNDKPIDLKSKDYYLKQIPVTKSQLEKSTKSWAEALYKMGEIYKDKIEDIPMAITTFEEYIRLFGNFKEVPDAYFNLYMTALKTNNDTAANRYKEALLSKFPNSKYHKFLSTPDYTLYQSKMYKVQDSIYNLTYQAYNKSDFNTVFKNVEFVQKNFPNSTIMPKFLLLNALSIGKKKTQEKFKEALSDLITKYPESDVSAMAKDIIALMKQGKESKNGTSGGSLLTRRDEQVKKELSVLGNDPKKFSSDKLTKHRLMLISKSDKKSYNQLQYQIASFNFSKFMIKDFDLSIGKIDTVRTALHITNLESYEEAKWYENTVSKDSTLAATFREMKIDKVIISEDNFKLLKQNLSLNEYFEFISNTVHKTEASSATLPNNKKKQLTKNKKQ